MSDWEYYAKLLDDIVADLKEIAITINNHELARMKVEKWIKIRDGK